LFFFFFFFFLHILCFFFFLADAVLLPLFRKEIYSNIDLAEAGTCPLMRTAALSPSH
jgi:hypothetical protein